MQKQEITKLNEIENVVRIQQKEIEILKKKIDELEEKNKKLNRDVYKINCPKPIKKSLSARF